MRYNGILVQFMTLEATRACEKARFEVGYVVHFNGESQVIRVSTGGDDLIEFIRESVITELNEKLYDALREKPSTSRGKLP